MKTGEIVGLILFALLVLGALTRGIWEGAQRRKQVARYVADRGHRVLEPNTPALQSRLEQLDPDMSWYTNPVIPVEAAPRTLMLFGYQSRSRKGSSTQSMGFAVFAERSALRPSQPVSITTRVPLAEKLVSNRVEVSGELFQKKFTVMCANTEDALLTVNHQIQQILLEHDAAPGWNLNVTLADKAILVSSRWAQSDQEWDYLIELTRRLRAALP